MCDNEKLNHLTWYRDKGRGQEACDHFKAQEGMNGSWPIAMLPISSINEGQELWQQLYDTFQVNATTVMYCGYFKEHHKGQQQPV